MPPGDRLAVQTIEFHGDKVAFGEAGVTDEERAAAGRETLAQRNQALLRGNRRRARRRYAHELPDGVHFARVWRRRALAELRPLLTGGPLAVWGEDDDVLHVLWQGPNAQLVGGVRFPMWPVKGAADLWELSLRVRHLDRAVIGVTAVPPGGRPVERIWHGSRAAPAPATAVRLAGTLVTREISSVHLGKRRAITVYRPPGPIRPMPLCLLADGQAAESHARVLEPAILAGALPPLILVGPHAAGAPGPYPDGRAREYLPYADPRRFAAHLAFVVGEVLPGFPEASHVISAGFSEGAAFALTAADRCPGRIAAAVALSPDLLPQLLDTSVRVPRYLAAGTLEPASLDCARSLAARLAGAGVAHRCTAWIGGHDGYWWRVHLLAALTWLARQPLPRAR
ncbi:alpha/beta hydrolase [Nonomuraea sp. NPDC003560]|uniref:alpha/beta hydrolase n=1 Tax=Nonomuraea sp. NPDC003560 TaxID=3364341 RepID=UPI0036AE1864